MEPLKSSSTETQQRQPEQKEFQAAPRMTSPAPIPETRREDEIFDGSLLPGQGAESGTIQQLTGDLSFSCLLIPRFSDHYLTGDITEYLVDWMSQICVSYGWRLDAIAVRPGYLQWVVTVPLATNPAHLMRITRRHTSQRIFDEFPRYKQKNISGEFWAPGNLVLAGGQLLTPEKVNNLILQTRRHQGIV
jgi:REP element-mobilizing transposase RayT